MEDILEKIVSKRIVVAHIIENKLFFCTIENYQYKKKYDNFNSCELCEILPLMKFIAEYDYFIFFQNIKHSSQNLFYNLVSLEKIIYVDEICKKVLIPPFDYTIDDILCNLDYTFSYIFGQTNNKVRDKDADGCIIQILKILKYLKLNIVCNFKIFNSILEKKNNMLRVVSFNVFSSIQDLKKNETFRQWQKNSF
jgi:hypothetical protein